MVAEWKEFLWDVAEERVALWGHCQTLFIRYSYPALQVRFNHTSERNLPDSCFLAACSFILNVIFLLYGM